MEDVSLIRIYNFAHKFVPSLILEGFCIWVEAFTNSEVGLRSETCCGCRQSKRDKLNFCKPNTFQKVLRMYLIKDEDKNTLKVAEIYQILPLVICKEKLLLKQVR